MKRHELCGCHAAFCAGAMWEQAGQWEEHLTVQILPSTQRQAAAALSLAGGRPPFVAALPQLLPGALHKALTRSR